MFNPRSGWRRGLVSFVDLTGGAIGHCQRLRRLNMGKAMSLGSASGYAG